MLQLLVQAERDAIAVADESGAVPLHAAASAGHDRCCRALLDAGASPLVFDKYVFDFTLASSV